MLWAIVKCLATVQNIIAHNALPGLQAYLDHRLTL